MPRNYTILNELKELNSQLAEDYTSNVYLVPDGYFDELATKIVARIKATEIQSGFVSEEIELPPVFKNITRNVPYSVPVGYFEKLQENILSLIRNNTEKTVSEELAELSPILSSLKKEVPYVVPNNYFERISPREGKESRVKIISIVHHKMFRYAAAAIVTGVIVLAGFLIFNNKGTSAEPGSKALAKFTKDVKKMDNTQKDELIEFIDAGMTGEESAGINPKNQNEIKELLNNIPEQELLDFQKQSEDIEPVVFTN